MSTCTYELLQQAQDKCLFATTDCPDFGSYFNLLAFHYCNLNGALYFTLPIYSILIFFTFYLVSDTANKYLSSSLTITSDLLGLSQSIAAMTLLAFGNGSPDVISSVVATNGNSSPEEIKNGIQLALGALFGSGMVLTAFVFSMVIFFSKSEVKVIPKMFMRECLMYLFALLLLVIFSIDGKIRLWEAICFLSIYFVNLILALCIQKYNKRKKTNEALVEMNENQIKENNHENPVESNSEMIVENIEDEKSEFEKKDTLSESGKKANKKLTIIQEENYGLCKSKTFGISEDHKNAFVREETETDFEKIDDLLEGIAFQTKTRGFGLKDIKNALAAKGDSIDNIDEKSGKDKEKNLISNISKNNNSVLLRLKSKVNPAQIDEFQLSRTSVKILTKKPGILFRIKKHYFNQIEDFNDLSLIKKALFILIDFPLTMLRDLSIPAVENSKYNKLIFCMFPFFSVGVVIFVFKLWTILNTLQNIIIVCSIPIVLIIIQRIFCYNESLPKVLLPYCILNFGMSIVWIYFASSILVDIIQFIGLIFNLSIGYLGLTLVAIGNSAPDMSIDTSLAKNGFGEMAIAGAISGPLFNLLIGLGVSLIQITSSNGTIPFSLFSSDNYPNLVAFLCLSGNLFITLIISKVNNFHMKRINAFISLIIFFGYLVMISLITFKII